jgi:hypothetical protein
MSVEEIKRETLKDRRRVSTSPNEGLEVEAAVEEEGPSFAREVVEISAADAPHGAKLRGVKVLPHHAEETPATPPRPPPNNRQPRPPLSPLKHGGGLLVESRGACAVCGEPVLVSQLRDKNEQGLYLHTDPTDCPPLLCQ